MTDFLYKTIQDALTRKLYPERCTNRQEAFNTAIRAAKSIVKDICKETSIAATPEEQCDRILQRLNTKLKCFRFNEHAEDYRQGLLAAIDIIDSTFHRYKGL